MLSVCFVQRRIAWCVTQCVQKQGAGVPALTSACPADTSVVGEPVWTPATFMKG